jgi:MtrB/PioB family decaheme-associated outer membrane protein
MNRRDTLTRTGIAMALLLVLDPARAAEMLAPYGQLNTGSSTASAGLGYADSDGRRFGQYNGVITDGFYGLFDFSWVKRDDETGTWLGIYGRNVGLDNRQLRFEQTRQGNWGYFVEYNRIPRFEPYTVLTGVSGISGNNLVIPSTPTTPPGMLDLKTVRDNIGLGFDKFLFGNWDLQVRFRNEEKDGTRVFARGTTGTGPVGSFGQFEFTPEPINTTTRQLDVKINYTGSDLQLAGGYYGTFFNNQYNGLNITGGLAGLSTFTPIALPPDNQSHQFYLAGNYGFTPTTRGNFKVAYARATQDDSFVTGVNVPLSPGIGNNLQGKVETTLVQAGITSNPIPKLSLLADLRYEDRNDKTPVLLYLTPAPTTSDGGNEPRSIRTTTGKAEASYSLPYSFRLTGGIAYEEKHRNTSPVRIVSYREDTDETSYRVELRRMMSETVTGALSYIHSDRDGSPWVQTTVTGGGPGSNLIAPIHLADRKRDKVRLLVNWAPIEPLTLNFTADGAKDDYNTRDGSIIGPMDGTYRNYSIDVSYAFTQAWQASAWYSYNKTKARQTLCESAASPGGCPSTATDPSFGADVRNKANSFGLGFRGKPNDRFEVGGDLSYTDITDSYNQFAIDPATSTVPATLPEISTKLTRLNLFAKYVLQKNSGLRLDYIFDRYSTNDWTWSTWMYADGTRLIQDPNQKVNFIGVSYYYKWQ